jgi:hypothetical protein
MGSARIALMAGGTSARLGLLGHFLLGCEEISVSQDS